VAQSHDIFVKHSLYIEIKQERMMQLLIMFIFIIVASDGLPTNDSKEKIYDNEIYFDKCYSYEIENVGNTKETIISKGDDGKCRSDGWCWRIESNFGENSWLDGGCNGMKYMCSSVEYLYKADNQNGKLVEGTFSCCQGHLCNSASTSSVSFVLLATTPLIGLLVRRFSL
jgi:hypothetical protein